MTLSLDTFYLPVALFAFSMSATPGPNNVMLTASGANYGFRRTVPHMLGISSGFLSLIALVAAGLGALFLQYPTLQTALKIAGSAYLLYLGWKIACTAPRRVDADSTDGRPLTYWQAATFQYANPKAWVMAISAVSAFTLTGSDYLLSAIAVSLVCAAVNLPSISLWAGFGVALGRLLRTPRAWRVFNVAMGALTAGCVVLIAFH